MAADRGIMHTQALREEAGGMVRRRLFWAAETLLYAAFLTLDLLNAGAGWSKGLKYASILLCFAFAWAEAEERDGYLVGTALGFTLAADWFLLVVDRWYLAGVCAFCVVQVLYLVRIHRLGGGGLGAMVLLRAVLVLGAEGVLAALGLWEPLTAVSALYFIQLVVNALESLRLGRPGFALGLWLFVCCDVCVGLRNLSAFLPEAGHGWLFAFARVGMWLFYLPSQVLIASSVRKE